MSTHPYIQCQVQSYFGLLHIYYILYALKIADFSWVFNFTMGVQVYIYKLITFQLWVAEIPGSGMSQEFV